MSYSESLTPWLILKGAEPLGQQGGGEHQWSLSAPGPRAAAGGVSLHDSELSPWQWLGIHERVAALLGNCLSTSPNPALVRPMITPWWNERMGRWSGNSLTMATFPNAGPRSSMPSIRNISRPTSTTISPAFFRRSGRIRREMNASSTSTKQWWPPNEKLKSLPQGEASLKPGVTFAILDATVQQFSDNHAADCLQTARQQLFTIIHDRTQNTG